VLLLTYLIAQLTQSSFGMQRRGSQRCSDLLMFLMQSVQLKSVLCCDVFTLYIYLPCSPWCPSFTPNKPNAHVYQRLTCMMSLVHNTALMDHQL
jgi:hypothetical protein